MYELRVIYKNYYDKEETYKVPEAGYDLKKDIAIALKIGNQGLIIKATEEQFTFIPVDRIVNIQRLKVR